MASFISSNSILHTSKSEPSVLNSLPQKNNFGSSQNLHTSFFSRVKKSDLYLKAAIEEGLLDSSGTFIDPKIDEKKPAPSLENNEYTNINNSLSKTVQITKPTKILPVEIQPVALSISTPISKMLFNIQQSLRAQHISDIDEIKLVGGVVPHCLRTQFLERWLIGLFGSRIGNVPTLELLNQDVCKHMEGHLNDIDSRIVLKNTKYTLKFIREELLKIISKESLVNSSANELASFLQSLHDEYAHITPSTKDLVTKVIKAAYLLKSYSTPNPNSKDQLAIVSFGDRDAMVFEILLQIQLERPCLFRRDSLRINIAKFLENGDPSTLMLESDFQINQVLSDWNGQVIHIPNHALTDEDDWPALISRMVAKGDRCLIPGSEKKLFDVFAEKAKENKKELPAYIIECFSKRITNHHYEDAEAKLAVAIQVCSSMRHCGASSTSISEVWKRLTKPLLDNKNTLLHQISNALENSKITFEDIEACIALGSFEFLNTAQETEEGPVLLTQHEGTVVEIQIKENNKTYHLWNRFDPPAALEHILKSSAIKPELQSILETFSKWSAHKPVARSSYKDDLPKMFNLETFSNQVHLLVNNKEPSLANLGVRLYLACQTLQPIPPSLLLEKLPHILINLKTRESRLHLIEKVSNIYPEQLASFLSALKKAIDTDTFEECAFREQWIASAAGSKEDVLKNSALELAFADKDFMQYFKKLLPSKAGFAITLVQKAFDKKAQSPENLVKAIGGICIFYPKYDKPIDRQGDLGKLYEMMINLAMDSTLQPPKDSGNKNLIHDAFIWLMIELYQIGKVDESFKLCILLCKKGLVKKSSPQVSSHLIDVLKHHLTDPNIQTLEKILQEAHNADIDWSPSANELPENQWIYLTKELYQLNTESALQLADKCCKLLVNSKDPSASSLILIYLNRLIKNSYRKSEDEIDHASINPENKRELLFDVLNKYLRESNYSSAKRLFFSLMNKGLAPSEIAKFQKLSILLTTINFKINQDSTDSALQDFESLINNDILIKTFSRSPQGFIDLILLGLSKCTNEKSSQNTNLKIALSNMLLEQISDSISFEKSQLNVICNHLLENIPLIIQSDKHGQRFYKSWQEKYPLFMDNFKVHGLFALGCRWIDISLSKKVIVLESCQISILRFLLEGLKPKETSSKDTQSIISICDSYIIDMTSDEDSIPSILTLGISLLDYNNIKIPQKICKKLLSVKNIGNFSVDLFLKQLFNYLKKTKQISECASLLLSCKERQIEQFASTEDIISIVNDLLQTRAKSQKKQLLPEHQTAVNLIFTFSVFSPEVWNSIAPVVEDLEEKDSLIKAWRYLSDEAEHKKIFGDNISARLAIWKKILAKLLNHGIPAAADLEYKPLIQNFILTCSLPIATELHNLRCLALIRKLQHEKNPETKREIQNTLLYALEKFFKLENAPKNDDAAYSIHLDIAQVLLRDTHPEIFNKSLENFFSYLNYTIPKHQAKITLLSSNSIKKIYLSFTAILENQTNLNDRNNLLAIINISEMVRDLSAQEIDPVLIINKLTSISADGEYLPSLKEAYAWASSILNTQFRNCDSIEPKTKTFTVKINNPGQFGIVIVNLIEIMLKVSLRSTFITTKKCYYQYCIDIFSSNEFQKYFNPKEHEEKWLELGINLLNDIESSCGLSSSKPDLNTLTIFYQQIPTKPFLPHPKIFKQFAQKYVATFARIISSLNIPVEDARFNNFYSIFNQFKDLISKERQHHPHLRDVFKDNSLEYHNIWLSEANCRPTNTGSKILVSTVTKEIPKLLLKDNIDIKSVLEFAREYAMIIVRSGAFVTDNVRLKVINLIVDIFACKTLKSKQDSRNNYESLEIIFPLDPLYAEKYQFVSFTEDDQDSVSHDAKIKKDIITKSLQKLLKEPPSIYIIFSIWQIIEYAFRKGYFETVEEMTGFSDRLDDLQAIFLSYIHFAKTCSGLFFKEKTIIWYIKRMTCNHNNDTKVLSSLFRLNNKFHQKDKALQVFESLVEAHIAIANLPPSEEFPSNNPTRLYYLNSSHVLIQDALAMGIYNDNLAKFFTFTNEIINRDLSAFSLDNNPQLFTFVTYWIHSMIVNHRVVEKYEDIYLKKLNSWPLDILRSSPSSQNDALKAAAFIIIEFLKKEHVDGKDHFENINDSVHHTVHKLNLLEICIMLAQKALKLQWETGIFKDKLIPFIKLVNQIGDSYFNYLTIYLVAHISNANDPLDHIDFKIAPSLSKIDEITNSILELYQTGLHESKDESIRSLFIKQSNHFLSLMNDVKKNSSFSNIKK